MRIFLRNSLALLAVGALALAVSCKGGSVQGNDPGNPDTAGDVQPDVPDAGASDADVVDAGRDTAVPPDVPDGTEADDGQTVPDGDVEVPPTDEGVTDTNNPDVSELCTESPGSVGCPCSTFGECTSGLCVETMDGSVCSKVCGPEIDCPTGWTCEPVTIGVEQRFFCIYPFPNLCRPCLLDEDCVPPTGAMNRRFLCIDSGPAGKFCGAQCETSADCPTYRGQTFDCVAVAAAGGAVKQCRPTSNECPCTKKYQDAGYTTECYNHNDFGTCKASRTCDQPCLASTPQVETCNLKDDNCNQLVDELIPARECDLTIEGIGTCKGKAYCVGGSDDNCQGTMPSVDGPEGGLSTCNGRDDDCDGTADEGFPDQDLDGIADCVDPDIDGDNVPNNVDNCPTVANTNQANNDAAEEPAGQKKGDACDDDDDNDGVPDVSDNCALVKNPTQANKDLDAFGDACDCDADNDTVANLADLDMLGGKCPVPGVVDNCTLAPNLDQLDTNGNHVGDACDCDIDSDTVANNNPGCPTIDKPDNCRAVANSDQTDTDLDNQGDACDCDIDNDGVMNNNPGCTVIATPDNCTYVKNADQADVDFDKIGDKCDCDIDNDTVYNENPGCPACSPCDNCPYKFNPGQEVLHPGDTVGTACNDDWDSDGVKNDDDNCPVTPNPRVPDPVTGTQPDLDLDRIGDACDCDVDEDGIGNDGVDQQGASCPVPPVLDNCPRYGNPDQADFDTDHIGDACDCDIDGDGDPQQNFECPTPLQPDCEPYNAAIFHAAFESCNGFDDNCNGQIDEENATFCQTFYYDGDNDGYGTTQSKCLCAANQVLNYRAPVSGDCNDADPTINPGVQEICGNGRDDNCNGSENDLNALTCTKFYFDNDGDDYGTAEFECRCFTAGGKFTGRHPGDCNDDDVNINPGKQEICNNGVDDNCVNGQNDENASNCRAFYFDGDADTYGTSSSKCFCFANDALKFTADRPGDCDDIDPAVNPGMREVCNNSKDDNCDGFQNTEGADLCLVYYFDNDQDTYGVSTDHRCLCAVMGSYSARDGGDCKDNNPNINPGVTEACDGIDNNCDGNIDEDPNSTLCPARTHGTGACKNGQCVVGTCDTWFYDVNGVPADGCECEADAYDKAGQGATCNTAVGLAEVWDDGSILPLVEGYIVPGLDEDWFSVLAKDGVDAGTFSALGHDKFNLYAEVKQPTDGSLKVEVHRGACGGSVCAGTIYQWKAENEKNCVSIPNGDPGNLWSCCAPGECQGGATTENGCCNNVAACTDVHSVRHCMDDESTFYIRVFRDPSFPAATSCSQLNYVVEISNGRDVPLGN